MNPRPATREVRRLRGVAIRLGIQSGTVVALIVAVLVGTALLVVLRNQRAASEQLLAQSVTRADDVKDPPSGVWLTIRSLTGQSSSRGIPPGFPDQEAIDAVSATGAPIDAAVEVDGTDYLVRTEKEGDRVVQAVLDLSADHATRDRLVEALTISGLLGLALAVAAGLLLAGRAMRPLVETMELQRRFVADASHELRTPLTLLSTRAQLVQRDLRHGADPAGLEREIDGIVADADNLALVLEDLLLAADRRTPDPALLVDLGELATQVVAAASPAAGPEHVAVSCHRATEPVLIAGTAAALRRALTALLDNAVRHARTRVAVTVRTENGEAIVEIRDDGNGIDPTMLPRLFERHESSVGSDNGRRTFGLGLALLSEVVSQHHGSVSARNDQGIEVGEPGGAVFELRFPLAPVGWHAKARRGPVDRAGESTRSRGSGPGR